jgi:hypothetical protein
MAKAYRRHLGTRVINWWFRALTTLGLGASYRQILTVPGRKTGQLHSTPVDVIEVGGPNCSLHQRLARQRPSSASAPDVDRANERDGKRRIDASAAPFRTDGTAVGVSTGIEKCATIGRRKVHQSGGRWGGRGPLGPTKILGEELAGA